MTKSKQDGESSEQFISRNYLFLLFLFFSTILISFYVTLHALYRNCPLENVPAEKIADFNISNVRSHLKTITDFGIKISGSPANEIMTSKYIIDYIENVINSPYNSKNITYDLQIVSGSFYLQFVEKYLSIYDSVQNIIVRIDGHVSNDCLLINCHFDSAIESPGGSDDTISCANMLEVLRIVSLRETHSHNCLMLLFNGAEENILQASHGFITSHPWFKDIRGVVNLEAAGSGGNQILFQSGPGNHWLLHLYGKYAPYPSASVVAQDIFQSGLIPSDTDYRIFRDVGNISGVDFGFFVNGYVYHTPDDTDRLIDDCTISKSGENLLALTKAFLVNTDSLDFSLLGNLMYFDIITRFLVIISFPVGNVICCSIISFSLISALYSLRDRSVGSIGLLMSQFLLVTGSFIASIGVNQIFSRVYHSIGLRMSWYGNNFNLFLYAVPSFMVVMGFHHYFGRLLKNDEFLPFLGLETFALFNDVILLVFYFYQKGSMVYVFGVVVSLHLYSHLSRRFRNNWFFRAAAFFGILSFPILLSFDSFYRIISMIIPILGRSGHSKLADVEISVVVAFFTSYLASFAIEAFYSEFDYKKVFRWVSVIYLALVLLLYCTPLGFPFSGSPLQPRKRRMLFKNACRRFASNNGSVYYEDCGIYAMTMDSLSDDTIDFGVPALKNHKFFIKSYDEFPFYLKVGNMLGPYKFDDWNDRSPLNLNKTLRITSRMLLDPHTVRFTAEIEVTDHCSFIISPVNSTLIRIGLLSINATYEVNYSSTEFIYYTQGLPRDLFRLNFDIRSNAEIGDSVLAKMAVSWNLMQHSGSLISDGNDSYNELLKIIPDWIAPTQIRSSFYSIDLNY